MYLPVFDGKYELIEKMNSDETTSTWLVKASGSSVEFVMLTIKEPEIASAVSKALSEKNSPKPRNIIDWQVQDFTLDLICEKNESDDEHKVSKRPSSYLDKAEYSRLLLKSFLSYEKEAVSYQALMSSEESISLNHNSEFYYQFPLNIPAMTELGKESVCQNINLHLNKIFAPGIDKESHLYYNAAPPEVIGLLNRFQRNEIKSLADLYYAYTHSGFYKMFGDPAYTEDGIGSATVYRANREKTASSRERSSVSREKNSVSADQSTKTPTPKPEKKKKPFFGRKQVPPVTTSKEDAERHVHNIGAMNFNSALSRPSQNSRGMRHIKAMRRLKIAVLLILVIVATPLIAHATGLDDWLAQNVKKTNIGGAILNSEPVAAFAPDTGKILEDAPVTFINQSLDSDPNDSINNSQWTITYKNAVLYESQEMHMLYSFPSEGNYTVSLVVQDTRGKSSKVKTIDYQVTKPAKGSEIPGSTIK